jgi:hypothetical protein
VASTWVHADARAKVLRNLVPGPFSSERMLTQRFGGSNRSQLSYEFYFCEKNGRHLPRLEIDNDDVFNSVTIEALVVRTFQHVLAAGERHWEYGSRGSGEQPCCNRQTQRIHCCVLKRLARVGGRDRGGRKGARFVFVNLEFG